jgi:hypothetical protein
MAEVVQGAVIVKDVGRDLVFKNKCESCGKIDSSTHGMRSGPRGWTYNGSFRCSMCGAQQKIIIKGTD